MTADRQNQKALFQSDDMSLISMFFFFIFEPCLFLHVCYLQCEGPPEGKEVCFTKVDGVKNKCGCETFKPAKCNMVPAGDCPKGTVAQGGFDLCGCPHQICVPCAQ